MDLSSICEILQATQLTDGEARQKAEKMLDKAAEDTPDLLVAALAKALDSAEVAENLRQEAAVILRQLVTGLTSRESVWENLEANTKRGLCGQVLKSVEADSSKAVRRSAGQIVTAIAAEIAEDFGQLQKEWPEVLPALSAYVTPGREISTRVVALEVLKDLVAVIGDGLLAQGQMCISMLATQLGDQSAEVRSCGAQLVLHMIELLATDTIEPLGEVLKTVVLVIQNLANQGEEAELKDVLETLISATEDEADFFHSSGVLKDMAETLLKICNAGPQAFDDSGIRHSAMEAIMNLAVNLSEEISEPEGHPLLEMLIGLNLQWMTEVEEDVDVWTKEGKDDDDDDCDDEVVAFAEENLDRLAENFEEDVFMPILFKAIRAMLQQSSASWKHARSSIMAVAQVVEYLEDESWTNHCVDHVIPFMTNAHARVRYAAYWALSQACYDQSPDVQTTYHETLLPKILGGLEDSNIRVATCAASLFSALGEELDDDDIEPFMDPLLERLFKLLQSGESTALSENCLSGIAVVAEAAEEQFKPYYPKVMPMLKQVIVKCTHENQKALHGKAFECVSLIGRVVGKEIFQQDAGEVMAAILPMVKGGFAGDDPRREAFIEATGRIAQCLDKDFKPYVPDIIQSIFAMLAQTNEDDDDEDEEEKIRMSGIKTTLSEEKTEAMSLLETIIDAMHEDFCDFVPGVVQSMLPLNSQAMTAEMRKQNFGVWESLAISVRAAVDNNRMGLPVLQELCNEFLKSTIKSMMLEAQHPMNAKREGKYPSTLCTTLHVQASGISTVLRQVGQGAVGADTVKDLSGVISEMMKAMEVEATAEAEPGLFRRRGGPIVEEDSDGEEKEEDDEHYTEITPQSVRFALIDVVGALMRACPNEFAENGLSTMMALVASLVKGDRSAADRSLGFYLADEAVAIFGKKTVPFWNGFMNEAITGMQDACPIVRQYCASVIGNGSPCSVFSQVVPTACSTIHQVLQRHGERHRRRRAVKADAKQAALAIDSCIRALGQICQYHEQSMGSDAGTAWGLWLDHLPIKYNADASKAAHNQLVDMVMANHAYLTAPAQLPKVFKIMVETYKAKWSTGDLDKRLANAVASIPESALEAVADKNNEKQKKKVENMLKLARNM